MEQTWTWSGSGRGPGLGTSTWMFVRVAGLGGSEERAPISIHYSFSAVPGKYRFMGHSPADPEHERGRKTEKVAVRKELDVSFY